MKEFLLSKLIGWVVAIFAIAMIFIAGWLLQITGLSHGRWQSFTMFLPAMMLLLVGFQLQRLGRKGMGIYVMGVMFLIFGTVILFNG